MTTPTSLFLVLKAQPKCVIRWAFLATILAAIVWVASAFGLPIQVSNTLLPGALGTCSGLMGFLFFASRLNSDFKGVFKQAGLAFSIGLSLTFLWIGGAALFADVDILDAHQFSIWMPVMAGLSVAVFIAAFVVEKKKKRTVAVFTTLLAGLALATVLIHNAKPVYGSLVGTHLRTWNMYHYYIGSKYFEELGYLHLYSATLAADNELKKENAAVFSFIKETRDMKTYRLISRDEAVRGFDRSVFDDARWEEFKHDLQLMAGRFEPDMWRRVFRDWGYNPAPPWTVLGVPVSKQISQESRVFLLVANSDLPLFVLIFGALWWAFGLRTALLGVLWVNLIHFNRGRFAGGFLQYDWLAFSVLSVCLYHKGKGALGGISLGWAAMTRVFPGFMAVPIAVKLVVELARTSSWKDTNSTRRRFIAALTLSCLVLGGAACFTGRGPVVWKEWLGNIMVHADVLQLDPQHLGVGRLAQHSPRDGDFFSARRGTRAKKLDDAFLRKLLLQVLGGLLLLGALYKSRDIDAMVLMLFAVFLAVTVTRYYGSIWMLLFVIDASHSREGNKLPLLLSVLFLFGMAAWFYAPGPAGARYFLANYEAYAMFVALCAWHIFSSRHKTGICLDLRS